MDENTDLFVVTAECMQQGGLSGAGRPDEGLGLVPS